MDGILANVQPVHLHAAVAHIVKTGDKIDERGFSRAGRADDGDKLSRLCREIDILENIIARTGFIAEGNIFELDLAERRRKLVLRHAAVADVRLCFQHFVDALRACRSACELQKTHRNHKHAHKHLCNVHIEGIELAGEHRAAHDHVPAKPEHTERRTVENNEHQRHHQNDAHDSVQTGRQQLAVCFGKLFFFVSGAYKGFYHPNGHKVFLYGGVQSVDFLLKDLEEAEANLHQQTGRENKHRDRNNENKREPGVERKTYDERREELHRRAHQNAQTHGNRLLQGAHVVCNARDERGCGEAINAREGKTLHLAEKRAAQIPSKALTGVSRVLRGKHAAEHGDNREYKHHNTISHDTVHAARAVDAVIDDVCHQKRQKKLAHRFQNDEQRRENRVFFEFAKVGKEFFNHGRPPPWSLYSGRDFPAFWKDTGKGSSAPRS